MTANSKDDIHWKNFDFIYIIVCCSDDDFTVKGGDVGHLREVEIHHDYGDKVWFLNKVSF